MRSPTLLFCMAAIVLAGACAKGNAAGTPVDGPAALTAALAGAKGGETYLLAPGDYGPVIIINRAFKTPVVLVSADPKRPAAFESLNIANVERLTFRNLSIGRGLAPGEPEYVQINSIDKSKGIRLEAVHVHGSLDGDSSNDGGGLYVTRSNGIAIVGSEFEQLLRAFIFEQTSNILIDRNRFHDIRSDAGDFAAVDDVTITANHYTNFHPVGEDHPDAIQFWTRGQTRGSTNILIQGNEILQGAGGSPQGIFIRDELGGMPHRNIRIVNNLLYANGQWEGISVEGVIGLEISNNSVLSVPDDEKELWIRVDKATGVVIKDNVADRFVKGDAAEMTMTNNLFFHDSPGNGRKIPDLRAGATASVAGLVVAGRGYQPGAADASPQQTGRPPTP